MSNIFEQARKNSSKVAIISNANSYSYEDILLGAEQIASTLLKSRQDLSGARIAFMIPGSHQYIQTLWGIWMAGGIAVPLNDNHPFPSVQYILEDTEAELLILPDEIIEKWKPIKEGLAIQLVPISAFQPASNDRPSSLPAIAADRPAMILYTSGTTSKPKGVLSTHANIESQIQTLIQAWSWQQSDHILCVLPLHHVHGIINVCSCALWSGATLEFLPKFSSEAVFARFLQGKINLFMAVPTIYFKLIAYYEGLTSSMQKRISDRLHAFRLMVSGSAALPVSVLERWKTISGHTLLERYGMTEIGMAVSNPYKGERRPGHIGQPLPGVELRIVDEAGEEVTQGEQGEIQVKGPNVFREYWRKPQATEEAFTSEGWFKTGDVARWNNGYIRILGRNSVDIIKTGGYKVSALEIEEAMRQHPAIADCAVVGIPNDEWGELVAAALVLSHPDLNFDHLEGWLREQIATYKVPRKYRILDALPRNALGKVTKPAIKKIFLDENGD